MPDFERLFKNVGVKLDQDDNKLSFGSEVLNQKMMSNPKIGSTAYHAGFQKGDIILKVGMFNLNTLVTLDMILEKFNVDDKVKIIYQRYGKIQEVEVTLKPEKIYNLSLMDKDSISDDIYQNRLLWLQSKQ